MLLIRPVMVFLLMPLLLLLLLLLVMLMLPWQTEYDIIRHEGSPHADLVEKRAAIEGMPEGDDKKDDILLFNCITTIFGAIKQDCKKREFLSQFFKKVDDYYSSKDKRRENAETLKILYRLRDEKELENFKQKQRKRQEDEEREAASKRSKFA